MKRALFAIVPLLGVLALSALAVNDDAPSRVYELRTYSTAPERLANLIDRFREHNLRLFQRHGITLVGAWVPFEKDEAGDRLIYLVSFPSREAARQSWAAFSADPEWKALFEKEKEALGPIVTRVETVFLTPTDYSPEPLTNPPRRSAPQGKSKAARDKAKTEQDKSKAVRARLSGPRTFELRTYVANPGKLDALNTRFRDHTLGLFTRHGMTNVFYAVPMDRDKGAENTLTYLLAFPTRDAARSSWSAFSADPEWQRVRKASEADGTKLAAKVTSTYLKPVGFSPLK